MKATLFYRLIFSVEIICSCNSQVSSLEPDTINVITSQSISAAYTITGKKWHLIELLGNSLPDSINGKLPYIFLNKIDSTYNADGGCNGLAGKFEINEKTMHIGFTQGISTMMACQDMSVEGNLKIVFANADNYSFTDNILSLNESNITVLARFKELK